MSKQAHKWEGEQAPQWARPPRRQGQLVGIPSLERRRASWAASPCWVPLLSPAHRSWVANWWNTPHPQKTLLGPDNTLLAQGGPLGLPQVSRDAGGVTDLVQDSKKSQSPLEGRDGGWLTE